MKEHGQEHRDVPLRVTSTVSWQVGQKDACWARDQSQGVCDAIQTVRASSLARPSRFSSGPLPVLGLFPQVAPFLPEWHVFV